MRWLLIVLFAGSLYAQDQTGVLQLADTQGRDLTYATVEFKQDDDWTIRTPDEIDGYSTGPTEEGVTVSWLLFRRVPAGELTFRVTLAHYEAHTQTVSIASGRNSLETFTLVPTAGNRIEVTALNGSDEPVESARVRVRYRTFGATGADGKAVAMDVFRYGPGSKMTVLAEGYEESEAFVLSEPDQKHTVRLTRTARVHGQIKGTEGACCPVQLFVSRGERGKRADYATTCDVNGMFSITLRKDLMNKTAFKGGEVTVRMYLGGVVTEKVLENLKADAWQEVELTPPAGGSISGKITGTDGNPVAGLHIEFNKFPNRDCSTYTDNEGRYKVDALPSGEYILALDPRRQRGYPQLFSRKAKVEEGKETVYNVDLSDKLTIRVRAFIDNEPVTILSLETWDSSIWASTDVSHGAWATFHGVEPGTHRLSLGIRSSGEVEQRLTVASTDKPQEFEIYIEKGVVRGRVAAPKELADADKSEWKVVLHTETGTALKSVPVGNDGTFSITGLEPGAYSLLARAPGWCSKPKEIRLTDSLTVDLTLEPAGALRFRVEGDAANPLSVPVFLFISQNGSGEPDIMLTRTLESGTTLDVLDTLAPGEYSITFKALPNLKRRKEEPKLMWPLDKQTFGIRAGATTEITVKLGLCSGLHVKGLPINTKAEHIKLLDEDGNEVNVSFSVEAWQLTAVASNNALEAGTFKLKISVKGYEEFEQEVELKLGEPTEVDVRLTKKQ